MLKLLVVEDSPMVTRVLKHLVGREQQLEGYYAASLAECQQLFTQQRGDFFAALVDLNLPDAPNGEVVEFILSEGLPCIVLTASYSEERRQALLGMGVVDYLVKDSRYAYEQAIRLVNRLERNRHTQVLVVDDSSTARQYLRTLLRQQMFQVLEADHGQSALEMLQQHPEIRLMLTDYNMPVMDGFTLVKTIRQDYSKKDLIIIGLSSDNSQSLSARFIKNGANDFLRKPFGQEEFHCRVMNSIEASDLLLQIRDAALRDWLTGLYNRRYLQEMGEQLQRQAHEQQYPLSLALLDLDHFKRINDEYGHLLGDQVLQQLAAFLTECLGSRFPVARLSGEEFAVLMPGVTLEQAEQLMQGVRLRLEQESFELDGESCQLTVSIGITQQTGEDFLRQLHRADQNLFRAKETGRNFLVAE